MDRSHRKCIIDTWKKAERCVAGYETLYGLTKLSFGDRFNVKGMAGHSSDADDEITDVSGENVNCSPEICACSKQYYVLSGTKPFSLVIRRCSTPTTDSSKQFLTTDSSVSSPFSKDIEKASENEILNSDRKLSSPFKRRANASCNLTNSSLEVSDNVSSPFSKDTEKASENEILNSGKKLSSPFKRRANASCNLTNSSLEVSDNVIGQTVSDGTAGRHQEMMLNTTNESSDLVVAEEYTENIVCGSDLHVEVCTISSAENGACFNYSVGRAELPSEPTFEDCCNDSTDGNCSFLLHSRGYGCVKNDNIDNRNHYSAHPFGSHKNTHSCIHMHSSEHCKQEVELSVYNVGITKGGECQEMKAVDFIEHDAKSPCRAVSDSASFHMREHSESAEKVDGHNIQPEIVVGGQSNLKSNITESSLGKLCEGDDCLKCDKSKLSLLEIQGGNASELVNQNEECNKVRVAVSHDVDVMEGRNSYDEEDHVLYVRKQGERKDIEGTSDACKTARQNDRVESEKGIELGCESLLMQEIDYTSEEVKINMLQNPSVVNTMSNGPEGISLSSVGYQKFSTEVGNSESNRPVIHTKNRDTVPVEDDDCVQKHGEISFDDSEGSETQSSLCLTLSSKTLLSSVDVAGVQITDEIVNDKPANLKSEVIKNPVANLVSADELAENMTVGAANKFYTSKADHMESQGSVPVQSCTEDNVPLDTVHIELSPLLFSPDDDTLCYTETINCEQEIASASASYDITTIIEQKKLHRLQEALLGVPPPPSVTIPQHDVADILRLWKENKSLMMSANAKSEAGTGAVKPQTAIFRQSYLNRMKNSPWPESKYSCCYDIQYNRGRISEEFENLCQRLQERYVGSETTSSCNIWFNCDISNKVQNVKSQRRSTGHSPGSRLSHLARRRRTFSSANLLNSSVVRRGPGSHHSATAEWRLIMVDLKKTEYQQRSKSHQPHKQVPSVDRNRLQQTKRALFKSPPSSHKRIFSAAKSRSGSKKAKSDVDRTRIENSKRALWPCTSKNNVAVKTGCDGVQTSLSGEIGVFRKRKREEQGMLTPHNTCARRMLFGDAAALNGKSDFMTTGDNIQILRTGESKTQMLVSRDETGGLSEVHRKKLLWAVAEALRAEGITMSHPLFRPYATSLIRLVRNVMPDLNCKHAFSTSDLMLQLAKQYIGNVMKEQQNGITLTNSRT